MNLRLMQFIIGNLLLETQNIDKELKELTLSMENQVTQLIHVSSFH